MYETIPHTCKLVDKCLRIHVVGDTADFLFCIARYRLPALRLHVIPVTIEQIAHCVIFPLGGGGVVRSRCTGGRGTQDHGLYPTPKGTARL